MDNGRQKMHPAMNAPITDRDTAQAMFRELLARAAVIEDRFGDSGLPARKWLRLVRPYVQP